MRQSAIACWIGLTRATVNHIFQRHAATGTLCQVSPRGLLRRPHLVKSVLCWGWSDRIASYMLWPWWCRWGICMEWGLAGKPSTVSCYPVVTVPIDPHGNSCWLPTTAVSAWSGRGGGRTWQWSIGSMSSSVTSPDFNFTRQMAGLGYVVFLVSTSCKGARLIRSRLMVVRYTSGELLTVVPNRLFCSLTDTLPVSSTGAFYKTPLCHLPGSILGITTTTKMITPCSGNPGFPSAGQHHQDGAVCKIARLQHISATYMEHICQ